MFGRIRVRKQAGVTRFKCASCNKTVTEKPLHYCTCRSCLNKEIAILRAIGL